MRIFLDSSVLLSFCQSKKGASALVIDYVRSGKLKGYISKKVVFEVENNNVKDTNEVGKQRFAALLKLGVLKIVEEASQEQIKKAHNAFNNIKDEPIIAAAKQATNLQFILSLDNGFFKDAVRDYVKPLEILKPGEFVNRFREELEK